MPQIADRKSMARYICVDKGATHPALQREELPKHKLRKLSGKIKILKANIAESTDGKGEDEEATKQLTAQDLLIKEYDDILTARIIEKVIVHSRQEIEIYFIGGYTQKIDLI